MIQSDVDTLKSPEEASFWKISRTREGGSGIHIRKVRDLKSGEWVDGTQDQRILSQDFVNWRNTLQMRSAENHSGTEAQDQQIAADDAANTANPQFSDDVGDKESHETTEPSLEKGEEPTETTVEQGDGAAESTLTKDDEVTKPIVRTDDGATEHAVAQDDEKKMA